MTKQKDNIINFYLPGSELIFTRYLYVKDEVRISLLVSILKKSDDALFWAYELYYSGFKNELFELINDMEILLKQDKKNEVKIKNEKPIYNYFYISYSILYVVI